jgi:signal transduction histidine kinase
MAHNFAELVNLEQVRGLLQTFYDLTGVSSGIVTVDGQVLTDDHGNVVGAGWKRLCTDFHRVNPDSCANCNASDVELSRRLKGGRAIYTCLNGLVDAAIPVIIDGEHLCNLFTGQFFFSPPDPEEFRDRARRYGFDEAAYMAALAEVPIMTRKRVSQALNFLETLAGMLAGMGLTQKRLNQQLKAAERAVQVRSRFFAAASHDLRQPLQALRLFMDLLCTRLQGSEHEIMVTQAELGLSSAEAIVSALFDVARIESGQVTAEPCMVELAPLLAALAEELGPQARQKGLRFRLLAGEARVWTDPLLLERILRNLLSNAVRYTQTGGITLRCRAKGAATVIEVWDTGPGITPEHARLIWDEFYQVGNSARDRREGLGLGLSIAAKLAQLLGHGLDMCSKPGWGTVFRVTLTQPG